MITRHMLAEREEAKLHFRGARLVREETHDEGDPWGEVRVRRDAMLRRRYAFNRSVAAVRRFYRKRLVRIGWSYVGSITHEGEPVVIDDFELDQDPLPPSGEARPQAFELLFLSAEEPDPPRNYWPHDGTTPNLHFQTTFIVPSLNRRWYPRLTAEIWRNGEYLGMGEEWVSVTGFNAVPDAREQAKLMNLLNEAHCPEIDVTGAWDGEDEDFIRSREKFRWFIEVHLPSVGYETTLDEERHLSN